MTKVLASDIDDATVERFKARAEAEGKTPEQALHDLIQTYASSDRKAEALARLDAIRSRTEGKPVPDPVALIRQDRDSNHGRY
ncbi:hypothetical protein K32_27120 [Kaistia sp. 32K]|uniref:hypothetical protein n=1 Tax=Kaistia sp. 32K TaxID=2795690 RepID=UPI001915E56A|nr:hypothetical protein [Kaistia sp. 32K]BCP54095.1 hypothetical protein K32_27120 [Kaistia sp. 32K]